MKGSIKELKLFISQKLKESDSVQFEYKSYVSDNNKEYVQIYVEKECICDISDSNLSAYTKYLLEAFSLLKEEIKDLKIDMVKKEFHYGHYGFNSCHTSKVVGVITKDADFVPKTGVIKEKYELVGRKKLEEVLLKYPNYEIYLRSGYRFRGAEERLVDIERLRRNMAASAACDIEVKDNEIHVNTFTFNDLY